jgi:hypothetical protein
VLYRVNLPQNGENISHYIRIVSLFYFVKHEIFKVNDNKNSSELDELGSLSILHAGKALSQQSLVIYTDVC